MVAPNDVPVVETVQQTEGEQPVVEKVVKPVDAIIEATDKPTEATVEATVTPDEATDKPTEATVEATVTPDEATDKPADIVTKEPTDAPAAVDEMDDAALMEKAKGLLAEGKVAYVKLAYETAQDKLSECCEIITTVDGEKSSSLYTPMLYLAKTLLDLSRMEQPVVENALAGVEDTADDSTVEDDKTDSKIDAAVDDEKKMDDVADKVIEALDENAAEADAAKKADAAEKGDGDAAKKGEADAAEKGEDKAKEVVEAKVVEKVEEVKEETSEATNEEAMTEEGAEEDDCESTATEDITNIQLAYENAATARLIAGIQLEVADNDQAKSEWKANVAEALLVLGEICIADDECENAITELTACEKVQTEIWAASDRRIADTYFQFGRAFTNLGRFPEASEVYGKALKVISLLKEETSTKLTAQQDETKKKELTDEVTKMDELLKDIESWVKDSIDSHKSRMEAEEETKKEEATTSGAVGTTTDKEGETTNDISGLVRKRKADTEEKIEATAVSGDSPAKENGTDVGAEDAAVVAKKARLSSDAASEETPKETVAQ